MPSPSIKPTFVTSTLITATHGFFGSEGGVSTGRFSSLNTGLQVNDDPQVVAQNRAIVADAMDVSPDKFVILKQVHGPDCFTITNGQWPTPETQGDALVTDQPGIAIGVLSADCVPVLFESDGVVGAAHAGWGGAVKGVLENTIAAMKKLGAKNIRAAVGPAIAHKSYEVSHGFEKPFVDEDESAIAFFTPADTQGKWLFDLPGYCAYRLKRAGVDVIDTLDIDAYPEDSGYFSHRRASLKGEPTPGRQVSAISLKRA